MILVTGSAGFIGSNLCHLLQEVGEEFVHLDGFYPGSHLKNLDGVSNQVVRCDLCDEERLEAVFSSFPIRQIVHLAAESHVDRSISGMLRSGDPM